MAAKKTVAKKPAAKKTATGAATAVAEMPKKFSAFGTKEKTEYVDEIPIAAISVVAGFNPRANVGDVTALQTTIKQDGLLHYPIVAPADANKATGKFILVSGERRLKALKALKRVTVPCTVRVDLAGAKPQNILKRKAVAIAENSEEGRNNLNHIELGRTFKDFADKGWSVGRIHKETGEDEQKIRRCLRLMEAPQDVQKKVNDGSLSMIAGLEVAKLDDKTRKKIAGALVDNISASEVRKAAKAAAKETTGTTDGKTAKGKTGVNRDASLTTWKGSKVKQEMLQELAYLLFIAEGEEVGGSDFHEVRGAIGMILFDRGDLETPYLPSLDPKDDENPSKAKKLLKAFDAIVEKEAASYKAKHPEVEENGDSA